jgi:hypothetical protein
MNYSLDQQIEAAHAEAERIEADAIQLEARIIKAGGVPPRRQYGKPVSSQAIRENLTLVGLINAKDPALASYLGVQTGSFAREQEEREERQALASRMAVLTEQTRQQNQSAQLHRERCNLAGINYLNGQRRF